MKNRIVYVLLALLLLAPLDAAAHGIWGHVHVTGWAIENLPEGELAAFFGEPEVMHAALFGASFTDSGYWPQGGELARRSRAYSEHTHWEPFIEDFVAWIVRNDPPPWDSLASRQRVAFLLGAASHGLQDEIFDSLFLPQIQLHDGAGQEEADPGTDGFLALDELIRFAPTSVFLPYDTLLELYAVLGAHIDRDTIERSVRVMELVYLDHANGLQVARTLGEQYKDVIPWARDHYLDPDVPGSLLSEVAPTQRYMEALWRRLHGVPAADTPVIFAYPASPRRLRSHVAGPPDAWVTLIFSAGVRYEDAVATWAERDGQAVDFEQQNTRWGGTWPRLVRLLPRQDLRPGGWYAAGVSPDLPLIDGSTAAEYSFEFQVECTQDSQAACEDLGDLDVPDISGPDAGEGGDAGDSPDIGDDVATDTGAGPDVGAGEDTGVGDAVAQDVPTPSGSVGGTGGCSMTSSQTVWSLRRR